MATLRLGEWTVVVMCDGSEHRGVLYTADPESGHMVLVRPADDAQDEHDHSVIPTVLFNASIAKIVQEAQAVGVAESLAPDASLAREHRADELGDNIDATAAAMGLDGLDAAVLDLRREALISLLRSQRAPFEELDGGELLLLGCLRVRPPYTERSCDCENEIVLDRFCEMLSMHPLPGDLNHSTPSKAQSTEPPPRPHDASARADEDEGSGLNGAQPFAWFVPSVLPSPDSLNRVQDAARHYFDEGMSPPDVPGALCCTHWLPLEGWPASPQPASAGAPRNALEAAVLAVATAAARVDAAPVRGIAIAGCEWWLQEQWPDDLPKEMHTDKAVALGDGETPSVAQHPLLSSVFYLSDSGGPTAVFDQGEHAAADRADGRHGEDEEADDELRPPRVALGFPNAGTLLFFSGDRLHCVLHTPPLPLGQLPTDDAPRRTLLVNFWPTQPPGAVEVPLPELPEWHAGKTTAEEANAAGRAAAQPVAARAATWRARGPFAADAEAWKAQRLPPGVSAQLVSKVNGSRASAPGETKRLPRQLWVVDYGSDQ